MAASLQLEAREVSGSVNAANNTSKLYVRLRIRTGGGTYNLSGDTLGSITINGQRYSLDGKPVNLNSTTVLYEATHTIVHNADGSKSVTVAAEFDPNTPNTSRIKISQTVTLSVILRSSKIAATDANVGAVSTVSVVRRSSQYRHTIQCVFGSLEKYLCADGTLSDSKVYLTAVSIPFTIPSSFYAQFPNAPSKTCTLKCATFQGTTPIGDVNTATFTVSADPDTCAPTVTTSVEDVNAKTLALTGNKNKLVRYASTARYTLSASGCNSATVASQKINNKTLSGSYLDVTGVQNASVSYTVTDSRGFQTTGTVTGSMVSYVPLTVNVSAKRSDPTSGDATVTVTGKYFSGSFGSKSNTLSITCKVGSQEKTLTATVSGSTYRATASFTGLDYRKSHSVTVTAADQLNTVTRTDTIPKGMPVFDWGETDFRFNVPVTVPEPTVNAHAVNRQHLRENYLNKSGGIVTGELYVPEQLRLYSQNFSGLMFKQTAEGEELGRLAFDTDNRRTYFVAYNPDMDGKSTRYKAYYALPVPDAGMTEDAVYSILTSKNRVTVSQGGTGAVNAADARSNLGIGCTKLLSGAGTASGHGSYKMYLVMGKPASDASIATLLIPAAEVTSTAKKFQIADDVNFVSFNLSASGSSITLEKAAGSGSITAVYGIN